MDLRIGLDAARSMWGRSVSDAPLQNANEDAGRPIPVAEALNRLVEGWERFNLPVQVQAHGCESDSSVSNAEVSFLPPNAAMDDGCLDVHLTWRRSSRTVNPTELDWAERIVHTFARLLHEKGGVGDEGEQVQRRAVRFLVGHGLHEKRGPCATAIDVAIDEPCSVLVDGVLGDVAYALVRRVADADKSTITASCASARWTHLRAKAEDGADELGSIVVALAHWWATASPSDVVSLCRELDELLYLRIDEAVKSGVAKTGLREAEFFTQTLEVALAGLWQIRPLLGEVAEAEEELEGWQREIEVAIRRRVGIGLSAFDTVRIDSPRLPTVTLPKGVAWNAVYVPAGRGDTCARSGAPHLAHTNGNGRSIGLPAVPIDFFDGERTLVEVALRMCIEVPMSWQRACTLAAAWVKKGYVQLGDPPDYSLPDPESLKGEKGIGNYFDVPDSVEHQRSHTLLYFSYGSCMCRYSFRGTVPRYEIVGAARLPKHRLAYTLASVRRGGGAADVVEDPDHAVWGVLYRIPRKHLYRLDAREGVFHGRYERKWVRLEALGTILEPVLTYSVIDKAEEEIPPSDEYAGLIWDGAYGMLDADYCRRILTQFDEFGVEPASPL